MSQFKDLRFRRTQLFSLGFLSQSRPFVATPVNGKISAHGTEASDIESIFQAVGLLGVCELEEDSRR
eukprot:4142836-Lingulodinium_polyedra.AAC.1